MSPGHWIPDVAYFHLDVVLRPFDFKWLFAHSIAEHHAIVSARECAKRTEGIGVIHGQILESSWHFARMWYLVSPTGAGA